MTLRILVVGKARGVLESAIREFETRAGRYWRLEVMELDAGAPGRDPEPARVREVEAQRIRDRLPDRGEVWVLTREGKGMSSGDFARELGARALAGSPGISFVIGGAFGVDATLIGHADRTLSLSRMTLPHAAARLVLTEQLYRAGTILRGEPYHKGCE